MSATTKKPQFSLDLQSLEEPITKPRKGYEQAWLVQFKFLYSTAKAHVRIGVVTETAWYTFIKDGSSVDPDHFIPFKNCNKPGCSLEELEERFKEELPYWNGRITDYSSAEKPADILHMEWGEGIVVLTPDFDSDDLEKHPGTITIPDSDERRKMRPVYGYPFAILGRFEIPKEFNDAEQDTGELIRDLARLFS